MTVLGSWVASKLAPEIVTDIPTEPKGGVRLVRRGAAAVAEKLTPLLACPPTVTTTFPVVAPGGTGATRLVALQLVSFAEVPVGGTVLFPWGAPKFAPAIVTAVATAH